MSVWAKAGLVARIDTRNGPEIVVCREEGLSPDLAIRTQVGMLEHNRLAGTVPFRSETTDGLIAFRYRVAGLRKLRNALRGKRPRETKWEAFFASLGSALMEGYTYCIGETEYVLDPDWIWVGRDLDEVLLMAVPLVGFGTPERAFEQWKALYDCLSDNGLPEAWRKRLHPGRWEPETFSHRVWMEEVERWAPASGAEHCVVRAPYESPERDDFLGALARGAASQGGSDAGDGTRRDAGDGETLRFSTPRISSAECIRLLAATACAILFVLRPTSLTFVAACLGCVPLVVTLAKRYKSEKLAGEAGEPATGPSLASFRPEAATRQAADEPFQGGGPESLALRTTLLSDVGAEPTVLLSGMVDTPAEWALDITHEDSGRIETVEIGGEPLRFGRGPTGVDVVVDHAAASRIHLELAASEGAVHARDLGSTNGTYAMDRLMRPHESYELGDGDMLRLPGAVIRVRRAGAIHRASSSV